MTNLNLVFSWSYFRRALDPTPRRRSSEMHALLKSYVQGRESAQDWLRLHPNGASDGEPGEAIASEVACGLYFQLKNNAQKRRLLDRTEFEMGFFDELRAAVRLDAARGGTATLTRYEPAAPGSLGSFA